jgi:glycosyltransferase involved in cell wall biosynthesis
MKKVSIILPYYNRKDLILLTLKSLEHFYSNKNLEVVIVDDSSSEEHRLENHLDFNLDIKLVRLENKNGINPCYPYNVGVRESSGEILILSSPETLHSRDMFEISNDFKDLNDDTYLLFSVFCLTHPSIISNIKTINDITYVLDVINEVECEFHKNLGENGYSFNNKFGSWYTHSQYRASGLNFFTAITRSRYYKLSGFDERFRGGTGFDDDEFRDRLIESNVEFKYLDNGLGIHVNHEVVNNMSPTTNQNLYNITRTQKYGENDLWGKR